jgi:hypothetical protein
MNLKKQENNSGFWLLVACCLLLNLSDFALGDSPQPIKFLQDIPCLYNEKTAASVY